MYQIEIDYENALDYGAHWYGGETSKLPCIPNTDTRFYSILSLDTANLPDDANLDLNVPGNRLVLPHYINSDLITLDLHFQFSEGEIKLLDGFVSTKVFVYDNEVDLKKRGVRFRKLPDSSCPGNKEFDPEMIESPHHQLAGSPYFIQLEGHLFHCPKCGNKGQFILQFDTDYDIEFCPGDGGTVYYWWCDQCKVLMTRVEM